MTGFVWHYSTYSCLLWCKEEISRLWKLPRLTSNGRPPFFDTFKECVYIHSIIVVDKAKYFTDTDEAIIEDE